MTREEAIKILKAIRIYECYPKSASEETKEAIDMAIEALSDDTAKGVGRYENAMQKLREMPRYLNGVKEKQITKTSANYTTEKPNDVVEQKNDVVAEPTDLISREEAIKAIDYRRKTANIDGRIILDEVGDRIRELPSADRPSGEWVESLERNDTMHWFSFSGYCTNCGEWSEYLTTYCGECGAVMYALNNNGELVKHDGAKMGGK